MRDMSLYIDHKYTNLLSSRLQRFTRKSRELYNFRCPLCGDSSKNQFKARGYLFNKKQQLIFKCHNCGSGGPLKVLLDKIGHKSQSYFAVCCLNLNIKGAP